MMTSLVLPVTSLREHTTTGAVLQRILVEEWNAIPQQRVNRLVTSMRRRCQAVVAAYGFSTFTEAVLNDI